MSAATTIQVDFKKPLGKKFLGASLYRAYRRGDSVDQPTGSFYERPYLSTGQTWRKIPGTTESAARKALGYRRGKKEAAREGLAPDPYSRLATKLSVSDLADLFFKAGCPKRNRQPSIGKQLLEHQRRLQNIKRHLGKRSWETVTQDLWVAYGQARQKEVAGKFKKGSRTGTRAIDLERNTWDAMMLWAQRHRGRTGVTGNPLGSDRPRFHDGATVRHCRELQPESGEELHAIATYLFQDKASEPLAWQALFEAFVGQRTHEILKLRMDAKPREAGYIEHRKSRGRDIPWRLWLYRSITHKGTFPYVYIHPALAEALEVHREWHTARYPSSPWYFPSSDNPANTVDVSSLTKALARICPAMGLPHRTSHGLRSFHVNVLRSDRDLDGNPKLSDAEIALRIGHKSGGKLIVEVYGEIGDRITFLPSPESGQKVAWHHLLRGRHHQMELGI